jgi:hypothetical protein
LGKADLKGVDAFKKSLPHLTISAKKQLLTHANIGANKSSKIKEFAADIRQAPHGGPGINGIMYHPKNRTAMSKGWTGI